MRSGILPGTAKHPALALAACAKGCGGQQQAYRFTDRFHRCFAFLISLRKFPEGLSVKSVYVSIRGFSVLRAPIPHPVFVSGPNRTSARSRMY